MELTGTVVKTENNIASVMIVRASSCGGDCGKCKACPGESIVIDAYNKIDAPEKSIVKLEIEENVPLSIAFAIYILPIIMTFASGLVLYSFFNLAGGIIGAVLALVCWFLIIRVLNRKNSQSNRFKGEIVDIIHIN